MNAEDASEAVDLMDGGHWVVTAFQLGEDGGLMSAPDGTVLGVADYRGVSLESDWDNACELVLLSTAPDDRADAAESLALLGSATIEKRVVKTFTFDPLTVHFQANELAMCAVDSDGLKYSLRISPW